MKICSSEEVYYGATHGYGLPHSFSTAHGYGTHGSGNCYNIKYIYSHWNQLIEHHFAGFLD